MFITYGIVIIVLKGLKGSGLITCDDITSMYEKGVFTTPYDYVKLHFHLETRVNIPYCMYYGTFEYYTYIVNKVYENGKDCGYRVIPTLRYRENITQSYINICEIFNKFIKTFGKLFYPITNGEDIKKQFLNDFNHIENGLNYGCVFRYNIIYHNMYSNEYINLYICLLLVECFIY